MSSHKIIHPLKTPFQPLLFRHVSYVVPSIITTLQKLHYFNCNNPRKDHTNYNHAEGRTPRRGNGRGCCGGILSWARACATATCDIYCLIDSAYLCSTFNAPPPATNVLGFVSPASGPTPHSSARPTQLLCNDTDQAAILIKLFKNITSYIRRLFNAT